MVKPHQPSTLPKVVAIGGAARSGTTMLVRVLNSHPEVTITSEFGSFEMLGTTFYRHILNARKRWWSNPLLSVSRKSLWSNNKTYNLIFLIRYIVKLLPYWQAPITGRVLRKALSDIFPDQRIIGDKLPNFVVQLEELTKIENVYPVIIYRDPRDVARSWIDKVETGSWSSWPHGKRPEDVIQVFAPYWVNGIEAIQAHADELFVVCYEGSVTSPCDVTRELGD